MTTDAVTRDESETTGTPTPRLHFGGFDILRGLSSILIVIHHSGSSAYPGQTEGWTHRLVEIMDSGVPVFFVTSGFLIYRPLVVPHLTGRGRMRLADFWWRRLLRVVPAYWAALTFFWAIGNFDLGPRWWKYYTFVHIYDRTLVQGGLVQSWTLATEVAFYLAIPLWALGVGALVRRLQDVRHRVAVELALCAGLWATAIFSRWAVAEWWPTQRGASFLWLPMNLDTFSWGMAFAVVSVWCQQNDALRARLARLAARVEPWWLVAFAIYVWYALAVGPVAFDPGYIGWFWQRRQLAYLMIAVFVVFPVVFGEQGRGWIRKAWSLRGVVWTGTVSYGLYLWHFDWMKRVFPGKPEKGQDWSGWIHTATGDKAFVLYLLVGFGFGFGFAALSWYLLERPTQRFKGLFAPRGGRALGSGSAQK